MHEPHKTTLSLTASPVYLVAHAINTLVRGLPAGTGHNLRTAPHYGFGLLDLAMALTAAFDEA